MTTSRRAYKIDNENPGSDLAGETAAALAAASLVFRKSNPHYSHLLLHHAQQVCLCLLIYFYVIWIRYFWFCFQVVRLSFFFYYYNQLFEFGDKYRGRYDSSIAAVKSYYASVSGYKDELLWAAFWLHRATGQSNYLDYTVDKAHCFGGTGWAISEFSWDVKYAGVQIMAVQVKLYNFFYKF